MGPCVDGVFMPPMATGKRKRRYSRLPLVRASLCGHFPPRRLRWHRVSLSSHQNPKKILKNEKATQGKKLAYLVSEKSFCKNKI